MRRSAGRDADADAGATTDRCELLGRFAPVIFLLVLMLVFALLEPRFLSRSICST